MADGARRCAAWATVALLLGACAATPPALDPLPQPPPPLIPQACMTCIDATDEIARLRQTLASREAELRELRASHREQAKAAAASTRDAAQAQARQRRLATQADAASAIAEAEVAREAARERAPLAPLPALFILAQSFLDAATAALLRGDYAAAVERAVQAQALLDPLPSLGRAAPGQGAVPLRAAVPVQATARTALRRRPGSGHVVITVEAASPLVAQAYEAGYVRVASASGAKGWVAADRLALR